MSFFGQHDAPTSVVTDQQLQSQTFLYDRQVGYLPGMCGQNSMSSSPVASASVDYAAMAMPASLPNITPRRQAVKRV